MKSDQWSEMDKLCHAALEIERTERAAFLKQNCSDQKVREEVEALLNCEEEGDRLLEGGAWMGDRLELQ